MVEIFTLGDFDILVDGKSIMPELESQRKIIRLFKYFLIHYDKKILPEDILDDLFPDDDFKNPLNMIRTQISRLRSILNDNDLSIDPFFEIQHIDGYYVLHLAKDCKLDFIEFENKLGKSFKEIKKEIEKDYIEFKNLLFSYNGLLLREMTDEDWLIPIRSRFERLYVNGVSIYIDYLKERLMYNEIIEICEKAIIVKPYEENIHLDFMNTLIKLDYYSYASLHYEFYTKKIYNDLGIKPSQKLKGLYKKISNKDSNKYSRIDLNKLDKIIEKEFKFTGPMLCDFNYFKFIYSYEKRNKYRGICESGDVGVSVITIESNTQKELTGEEKIEAMDLLKYTLLRSLRFGDIVSKWNEEQMLLLLYALQEDAIEVIIKKINENFNMIKEDDRVNLDIKIHIL